MRVAFIGDISFNDDFINIQKNGLNPFGDMKILNDSDFVIGNLECFVGGDDGENILKVPRLKTSIEALSWLKTLNVSHVSLANNHVYDNLDDGFLKTKKVLNTLDIKYWGAEIDGRAEHYIEIEQHKFKVGILNYVDKNTNPCKPENSKIDVSYLDESTIVSDVKYYKNKCDILVVYIHWGGRSENLSFPEKKQVFLSNILIANGVDLIIGHHSHTIQPYFSKINQHVFYSLGNFCFSDIKMGNDLIKLSPKNSQGLVLIIDFISEKKDFIIKKKLVSIKNNYVSIVDWKKNNMFYVKNFTFNKIAFFFPFLINIPIFFNKYVVVPINFFRKGNLLSQIKKINYNKIVQYLK